MAVPAPAKRRAVFIVLPLLLATIASFEDATPAHATTPPVVYAVDPHSGTTAGHTAVAIFGTGFTGATGVQFGTTPVGNFFVADDGRIFASSPSGSGVVDVRVTTGGGLSAITSGDKYTYTPPGQPVVQAIDPRQGSALGGTNVTVFGSGFSTVTSIKFAGATLFCALQFGPAAPSVRLGSALKNPSAMPGGGPGGFAPCQIQSDDQLNVNSPPGTGTVDVTVTSSGPPSATSLADKFTYVAAGSPVVNAIGPSHGTANGGTQVTLFGTGFSGVKSVSFGLNNSVPACGAAAAPIRSHLARVSPSRVVSIRSAALIAGGGGGGSCFGPSGSDTMIFLQSPPSPSATLPTTVDVTVTTGVGTSGTTATSPTKYTYNPPGPPIVDAVGPNHGSALGGTNLTLFGRSFTGATQVNFGLTTHLQPCSPGTFSQCFSPNGDNNIFIQAAPSGQANTTVHVTVTVGAVTSTPSAADQYSFDTPMPPVIYAIDPTHASAAGGTSLNLYGANFTGTTDIAVGSGPTATHLPACPQPPGVPCFSPGGDTNLFLIVPFSNSAGPTTLTVTTPTSPAAQTGFTYDTPVLPEIDAVSPNTGPANGGTTVWITGKALNGAINVTFNGHPSMNFFSQFGTDSVIQATSPPGTASTTPVDVEVQTSAGPTAHTANDHFTYTAAVAVTPTVTAVSPNQGLPSGGTQVYMSGTGFNSATGVTFGTGTAIPPCQGLSTPFACFGIFSDNVIQVGSPQGTASPTPVDVRVSAGTNRSTITTDDQFTYTASPQPPPSGPYVNAVSPNRGSTGGGDFATIFGGHFTGATGVQFGTAPPLSTCAPFTPGACFTVNDDGSIFVNTPSGSGQVDITVMVGPASSSAHTKADLFTFVQPSIPTVDAVTPNRGPTFGSGAFSLQLFGSNLSTVDSVTIGSASPITLCGPSSFASCFNTAGDNTIFVNGLPPDPTAETVHITVHNPAGPSVATAADQFTYFVEPAPTVTGISPNTGLSVGGTAVYVKGTNFLGANQVSFGQAQLNGFGGFFTASSDLLFATSPPGQPNTSVDVTVSNPSGSSGPSSADIFSYTPSPIPSISAIHPNHGPSEGGTSVFISGRYLANVFRVKFGTVNSFMFNPLGEDVIMATSPPGSVGSVDITVMAPAGSSSPSAADLFTYDATAAPVVKAISPATGPSEGRTAVFISGDNLGNASSVKFGTTDAFGFFPAADNVLMANSPPGTASPTPVEVMVTTPSGPSPTGPTVNDKFTYQTSPPPVVLAVGPNTGPAGTSVIISGTDLGNFTGITFGTFAETGRVMSPSNEILATTSPPGTPTNPTSPVDVTVTVMRDGATTTSALNPPADQYTYVAAAVPVVTVISPNFGAAGTTVNITGEHLGGATAINFGNTSVGPAGFFIRSDNLIRVASPTGVSGTVDVTVTAAAGTSAKSVADLYSFPGALLAAVSTSQYLLKGSDGTTWTDLDAGKLSLTITPSVDSAAVLTGNADLWTSLAGYNQDIGIYVAESDATQYPGHIVAWKESGGFAGTFSPNAALVQTVFPMSAGTTYHAKLQWKTNKSTGTSGDIVVAGAGPWPLGTGNYSPTTLTASLIPTSAGTLQTAASTSQYLLKNSDGNTWQDLDATNLALTVTPSATGVAIISGNADLWTTLAGYNQDIGVYVQEANTTQYPGGIVAWKESGGFAGTFSPNAAFVQTVFPVTANTTYHLKLRWKTNKDASASGDTIVAGAGAWPLGSGIYSPTRLTVRLLSGSASPATAVSTQQYLLKNSDGTTWQDLDATNLALSVTPTANCLAVMSGNTDLWTTLAGYNQDIGIYVQEANTTQYPGGIVAWKESGGFAGTFSPNAAFVQTVFPVTANTTYHVKLRWKTNKDASTSGDTIVAGAGASGIFSPTRLTLELVSCS